MTRKYYIPDGEEAAPSQIGASLEALAGTIASRRNAGEESYTWRLLTAGSDKLLKKVMEEASEVALAAKDLDGIQAVMLSETAGSSREELADRHEAALDHLRYEAADVAYHLLVVLERYGIGLDEFAAELNSRMTDEERPSGGACIEAAHINRG